MKLRYADKHAVVEGSRQALAIHRSYPAPVAQIYYRHVGNATLEILYIHTIPFFRRHGIMRQLFKDLCDGYKPRGLKRVITGTGSSEGGAAWLTALGFTREAVTLDYTLDLSAKPRGPANLASKPTQNQ
jgi:GNAT superfamily N-acetyltransferase